MQIPEQYIGRWKGSVTGDRKYPYEGEIILENAGGETVYAMKQSTVNGTLAVRTVAEDQVVLDEETSENSWKRGTLTLNIDSADRLICVWRRGVNLTNKVCCESTMSRVESMPNPE
ncbi:MAG: hypothetical protein ACLQVD_15875 [Capsulimonadaceae bacterium]